MPQKRKRRLAAIWFADIVGYTEISARDEDAALALVAELQALGRESIRMHGGRLVKFIGDAVLATFDSVDSALSAGLTLQERYGGCAAAAAVGSRIRVGVHLGEIVDADDGDVYGDGVNTAARIQSMGTGSGVAISEAVYHQIRHRRAFRTTELGVRDLKGLPGSHVLYSVTRGLVERPSTGESRKFHGLGVRRMGPGIGAGLLAFIGLGLFVASRVSEGDPGARIESVWQVRRLTTTGNLLGGPVISADGRFVAFTEHPPGEAKSAIHITSVEQGDDYNVAGALDNPIRWIDAGPLLIGFGPVGSDSLGWTLGFWEVGMLAGGIRVPFSVRAHEIPRYRDIAAGAGGACLMLVDPERLSRPNPSLIATCRQMDSPAAVDTTVLPVPGFSRTDIGTKLHIDVTTDDRWLLVAWPGRQVATVHSLITGHLTDSIHIAGSWPQWVRRPDGWDIAYADERHARLTLFPFDSARGSIGGPPTSVELPEGVQSVSIGQGGRRLAFGRAQPLSELIVGRLDNAMLSDMSRTRRTTEGSTLPAVSPSEDRVAYWRGHRVVVSGVRPSSETLLAGVHTPATLRWSPDGRRLAFLDSATAAVVMIDAASSSSRLVAIPSGIDFTSLDWNAKDTSLLVLGSTPASGRSVLLHIGVLSDAVDTLITVASRESAMRISQDGRRVVLCCEGGAEFTIVDLDRIEAKRVPFNAPGLALFGGQEPLWVGDNGRVTFVALIADSADAGWEFAEVTEGGSVVHHVRYPQECGMNVSLGGSGLFACLTQETIRDVFVADRRD